MIRVIIWSLFILESLAADVIKPKECVTPYQENATCLHINDCPVIASALFTLSPKAIQFYKDSQCGCDPDTVCCGTSNDEFYPELVNCKQISKSSKIELSWLSDSSVCGLHASTDKIKGGEAVKEGDFPWLAALEYKNKRTNQTAGIRCAGTLINNRFVLTASHCILHGEFEIIKVWLGVSNITSGETHSDGDETTSVKKVNVTRSIPHELYDSIERYNDIGLLKLEDEIQFSKYIRPICILSSRSTQPSIGTFLTVAGWGITENGTTSDVKLKVKLPLKDAGACQDYLSKHNRKISGKQLCAGGERGKDACEGDSGGSLMYEFDRFEGVAEGEGEAQWIQLGIVSYGSSCGTNEIPGVYTRVASYNRWIIDKIGDKSSHIEKGGKCNMPDSTMGTCAQLSKCPETLKIILNKSDYYNYSKNIGDLCLNPLNGEVVVCCKKPDPISSPNLIATSSAIPDKTTCGILKEKSVIKDNGTHLPWIVGIEVSTGQVNRTEIRCLGTLISPRHVLTIADCVYGKENDTFHPTNVWVGRWNSSRCNKHKKIGIKEIIPHPIFSSPSFNQYTIIVLKKEIKICDYIRPICLNSPSLPTLDLGRSMTSVWLHKNASLIEPITTSDIFLMEEFPFRQCQGNDLRECIAKESMQRPMGPYRSISIMRKYKDKATGRMQWYLVTVDNLEYKIWYTQYDGVLHVPNIMNSIDWILAIIAEYN